MPLSLARPAARELLMKKSLFIGFVQPMGNRAGAQKLAIVKQAALRCTFPYALEGLVRRELELAGARLGDVQHSANVEMTFTLPQDVAAGLVASLNEAGHGHIVWLDDDSS